MERVYPHTSLRTDDRFGTDWRPSRGTGSVVSKFGFCFRSYAVNPVITLPKFNPPPLHPFILTLLSKNKITIQESEKGKKKQEKRKEIRKFKETPLHVSSHTLLFIGCIPYSCYMPYGYIISTSCRFCCHRQESRASMVDYTNIHSVRKFSLGYRPNFTFFSYTKYWTLQVSKSKNEEERIISYHIIHYAQTISCTKRFGKPMQVRNMHRRNYYSIRNVSHAATP